jgi:RNA polymerase sigma factor (sigma-70 family)
MGVSVAAETLDAAYRRHSDELIRYATVLVGPDDAADVVTDAMMRVFASDASAVSNLRAFLFRAVHHRAIDHQRAGSRRRRREASYQAQRSAPTVEPVAADARAALAVLSVQQRTVVFLTYWADQTPADIAEVLGVSEGTVRKQLARARARLREVLDD